MLMDPHETTPVYQAGASLDTAAGAVVLLHGRGASAQDILTLRAELGASFDTQLAWLAPQAAGSTWYPYSFLAPREENEPYLSSALKKVEAVLASIEAAGIERSRIVIAGFSQGACLTSEFVATHPARYAGMIAFTGGLIGPQGSDVSHTGELAGTPALLMGGDPDPHVPWSRVEQTAEVLRGMGAQVGMHRFPDKPHSISWAELAHARALLVEAFPKL